MGFKLQDQIQQIRNIPGKYKRVLLAMAQRARKDGTNMFEAKETIADKAGVSRWTAYRNIDGMVDLGALVEAASHECGNGACPKGPRHYQQGGNHWTEAFNLDLDVIFNLETNWGSKMRHGSQESRVAKRRKCRVAKQQKCGVAKCDAIQGYNPNHAADALGGAAHASALTGGSEPVSESVPPSAAPASGTLASLVSPSATGGQQAPSTPSMGSDSGPVGPGSEFDTFDPDPDDSEFADPDSNPESPSGPQIAATPRPPVALTPQSLAQMSDDELEYHYADLCGEPVFLVMSSLQTRPSMAALRKGLPICEKILTYFDDVLPEFRGYAAQMVIEWNHAHRDHKYATKEDRAMKLRTPEQMLKALESENAALINDYLDHNFAECEMCQTHEIEPYRTVIASIKEKREQRKRDEAEAARQEALRLEREAAEAERLAGIPVPTDEQIATLKAQIKVLAKADQILIGDEITIRTGKTGSPILFTYPSTATSVAGLIKDLCEDREGFWACKEVVEKLVAVPMGDEAKREPALCYGCGQKLLGEMILPFRRGDQRVCDGCYDRAYEVRKGMEAIPPRPGYVPGTAKTNSSVLGTLNKGWTEGVKGAESATK